MCVWERDTEKKREGQIGQERKRKREKATFIAISYCSAGKREGEGDEDGASTANGEDRTENVAALLKRVSGRPTWKKEEEHWTFKKELNNNDNNKNKR